ncbi:serine/threonine protein kinase [Oceanobacillus piezotolerans]|nr:protein kinase [Oceanobacillus piezotolerans]
MKYIFQWLVDNSLEKDKLIKSRYRVKGIIGQGSYGVAYICVDEKEEVQKVLKQLRPSKRKRKTEIAYFMKESEILKEIDHRQVPKFYEAFIEENNYFYVMEYIPGNNLENEIFKRKQTFDEIGSLLFIENLFRVVNFLHHQHIYHLDLRIPNLMIKDDALYIIDFGLAQQGASEKVRKELQQQDYYDLGDILLYLLYTTFTKRKYKKALPWTEELILKDETVRFLKRLLGIQPNYESDEALLADLKAAIQANS